MHFATSKLLSFSTLVLLLSHILVGCFGPYDLYEPDPKYIYNYAGDWQGSLKEQSADPRTAAINLNILAHEYTEKEDFNYYTYSYYSLKGTWSAGFSPDAKTFGVFQGTADAYSSNFNITFNFSDNTDCNVWVDGARVDNKITGIYYLQEITENGCANVDLKAGTFEIVKQ